jgi:hypothetical protein
VKQRSLLLGVLAVAAMACTRPATPSTSAVGAGIQSCDQLPQISAPAEAFRDTPIYVANEMPTEEIQAWASRKDGFEALWIDRDHQGWVTVAFSKDAAARQAELEAAFPGVGAVAVLVDWTMTELEALQQRVTDELMPDVAQGSAISMTKGFVEALIGVLSPERIAAVGSRFSGERVCVSGIDPDEMIPEGPQPRAGDGWRLLANEPQTGQPYRTDIAADADSYLALWQDVGLSAEQPTVDFAAEVVVWFGAVFGSSCPGLRLDDVVIDRERATVHGLIVLPGPAAFCTADANPYAFVVAVERSTLPPAPFAIQLGAEDPPAGAPEERTIVDVDLREPGSVLGPGDAHPDPSLPEPWVVESGDVIEPDFEVPFRLDVHCGVEWLGRLNDVSWRTDVPPGTANVVPTEWKSLVVEESIVVSVLLRTDPEPAITATAGGHALVYRPSRETPPGCD